MIDTKKGLVYWLLYVLVLAAVLGLAACGELEFGVETKASSGRPEVTVVTTTIAEIPEGMVLVTVTPTALPTIANTPAETAVPALTDTPSATATKLPLPAPTQAPATPRPPQPTATSTTAWAEILNGLTLSTGAVSPGNSATVNYNTIATSVLLCMAPPLSDQWQCQDAPLAGPYTFSVDPTTRTNLNLELRAFLDDSSAYSSEVLMVLCPEDRWFFAGPPTTCPAASPIETAAAFQRFENGAMVWLEDGQYWNEGEVIFILHDDASQSLDAFPESGIPDGPMPDDEYSPPDGRYVPESGFGRIWRGNSWVRQRLGWALAPEIGYLTPIQQEITNQGLFIYFQDDQDQLIVLSASSGRWAVRSQP
ncbi:hypothetical protein [Candidatus Leptofilum sp.]|uniref:hypothetical protein n=1 Tax=Candidatus Leptofilum sp. TaxID=3241576 RepID=UPI003B592F6A